MLPRHRFITQLPYSCSTDIKADCLFVAKYLHPDKNKEQTKEEKENWLKIKYYPEKNGEWTGKTIEGWIKKSDVE